MCSFYFYVVRSVRAKVSWSLLHHSEPTVFENYVQDMLVDDQMVELSLWDTAGVLTLVRSWMGAWCHSCSKIKAKKSSTDYDGWATPKHMWSLSASLWVIFANACIRVVRTKSKSMKVDNPVSLENVESKVGAQHHGNAIGTENHVVHSG